MSPDMILDAVPNAVVAQSLQGVEKSGFLQVNSSALLTQAKVEQFMQTLTTVPGKGVIYDGTNFQSYDPKNGGLLTSGSVTDTQIGSLAWAKITSVPAGLTAIAGLSCIDGKIIKRVSGAWACADDDTSGGGGGSPTGSASGDLSGTYPSPTVAKLQGRGVSVTAPADGQVLRYNNGSSQWEPYNLGIGDLKTNAGTPQFISASCTASQTLIWSSVTNTFQCTNIAINASQVSGLSITETDPKVGMNTTNYLSKWNGSALVASGVVESGGNIGIGTSAPTKALDVQGSEADVWINIQNNSSASGGRWPGLNIQNYMGSNITNSEVWLATSRGSLASPSPVLSGDPIGGISGWGQYDTTPGNTNPGAYIYFYAGGNFSASSTPGEISLQTTPVGSTTPAERVRITQAGNVGIGLTTPTTALDVNGTINATAMTINGVPVGTSTGMASLNGSSQATQTFTVPGATGTAPNWSTNTGTGAHTLNIPLASASSVTAGLISKTEYDTFNNKVSVSYSLAGDVTGTPAATVVDRIKGKSVSAAPTLTGQVLRYDGTNITPNFISMFDLRSTVTGTQAFGGVGCLSNQTLTWTSATDNLACANIAITGSQVSGNIAGNAANVTGTVAIANGGTGQATASAALNALLPAQSTNATKFLQTDGTTTSWVSALTNETDPKVGTNTTNYLSKWNGSALVASGIYESGGNVGIGTTSPVAKLEVVGALRTSRAVETQTAAVPADMWSLGAPSVMHPYFYLGSNGGYRASWMWNGYRNTSDLWTSLNANSYTQAAGIEMGSTGIELKTSATNPSAVAPPTRLIVTPTGDVGIGTTAPAQKLSVAGAIESTSGGFKFPDGTTQTTAATGGVTITTASASCTTANTVGQTCTATPTCSAGVSISGGFSLNDDRTKINVVRRSGTTAWECTAERTTTGTGGGIVCYVVCLQ